MGNRPNRNANRQVNRNEAVANANVINDLLSDVPNGFQADVLNDTGLDITRDAMRQAIEASMTDAPLPLGWEQNINSKGVLYYIDHVNQVTTFSDPRLTASANRNRNKKSKKKGKPPKYKRNLYAKVQSFLARLHQFQQDEGHIDIRISRETLFEDSYNIITCLDALTLTRRLFIKFEGEEGLDYGGMSREWFLSLSEEILSEKRHLFVRSASGYHFQINRYSSNNPNHLDHFKFVGMVIGMAVYHNKMFQSYFTVPFYKALLGRKEELSDLKYEDPEMYTNMKKLRDADDVNDWDLDFTITDKDENDKEVIVYLKENGENIPVTNQNKEEYISLILAYYFKSMQKQLDAIKEGFFQFVPPELLQEFDPEEIEQVLGGNVDIDVNDLKMHTVYGDGFTEFSVTIKLFWEVLFTLTQDELKTFLQFTTGSTKVPVGGFAHLYGSNGAQKFTIIPKKILGFPTAHSCFNRLELPNYTEKEKLKKELLYAINETHGFGLE